MARYQPPYKITDKILWLITEISTLLGRLDAKFMSKPKLELRKKNRIKSIYGTLSIEGNSFGLDHVTEILENRKVRGPAKDILEVQNAIKAYQAIAKYNYRSQESLKKAHRLMMKGLIKEAGKYRSRNVGILKGTNISHVAPPPKMIKANMDQLFDYLQDKKEHPLIKSCVFHYEFEFIHPFSDGNGRLGRLWQTVILANYHSAFEFLPVESLIKRKQRSYYRALERSDKAGESTIFVEFMLKIVKEALEQYMSSSQLVAVDTGNRIDKAKDHFGSETFARKDYMKLFPAISSATASRDLTEAVDSKILKKQGSSRTTVYRF